MLWFYLCDECSASSSWSWHALLNTERQRHKTCGWNDQLTGERAYKHMGAKEPADVHMEQSDLSKMFVLKNKLLDSIKHVHPWKLEAHYRWYTHQSIFEQAPVCTFWWTIASLCQDTSTIMDLNMTVGPVPGNGGPVISFVPDILIIIGSPCLLWLLNGNLLWESLCLMPCPSPGSGITPSHRLGIWCPDLRSWNTQTLLQSCWVFLVVAGSGSDWKVHFRHYGSAMCHDAGVFGSDGRGWGGEQSLCGLHSQEGGDAACQVWAGGRCNMLLRGLQGQMGLLWDFVHYLCISLIPVSCGRSLLECPFTASAVITWMRCWFHEQASILLKLVV